MRQNTVFSTNNTKKIPSSGGAQPLLRPLPSGEGDTPYAHPTPQRLWRLDPLHAEILGTPLELYTPCFEAV